MTPLPPATLLLVDDVPDNLKVLSEALQGEGHRLLVASDGAAAVQIAARSAPDLILMDVQMPGMSGFDACRRLKSDPETASIPVVFVTVRDETDSLAEGFAAGAVDYLSKPIVPEEVVVRVRCHLQIHQLNRSLAHRNDELAAANDELTRQIEARNAAERAKEEATERLETLWDAEASRFLPDAFIGDSDGLRQVEEAVRRVGTADQIGVLILGESGTGKELVARAIHYGSVRRRGPFVPVNCSAIPAELAESAFFGHVKGAFTGAAADHKGHFERAAGGTLFLDEVGDMPADLQVKLLRVLEDGAFLPVGGTREKTADVRVVAATNADLQERIGTGGFREDLYYRLARFTIPVPPLRERAGDIPLLVGHFLARCATELGRGAVSMSPEAMQILSAYPFPGNVRELRNVVEHALILCDGDVIGSEHLSLTPNPEDRLPAKPQPAQTVDLVVKRAEPRDGAERSDEEEILDYVREHGSINNAECRELLTVDRGRASYLLGKLTRYGLVVSEGERRWQRYRLP